MEFAVPMWLCVVIYVRVYVYVWELSRVIM